MTDVLIKRELLERLALPPASSSGWTEWNTAVAYEAARELRALLAEQPQADHSVDQPQGVAGQDQVLAYLWQTNIHTVPDLTRSRPEPGIHGLKFVKELVDRAAVLPTIPDGWVESLSRALVVEIERAIKQRDKFFETGVSTASHGGSHDTCFELIVRQHIACLNATHQDQSSEVRRLREALEKMLTPAVRPLSGNTLSMSPVKMVAHIEAAIAAARKGEGNE